MSNEIKKGDIVRVSKDAPRVYIDEGNEILTKVDSVVEDIEDRLATIVCMVNNNTLLWRVIPARHLIKVGNGAKEPRFKVGDKVKVNLPRSIRHNTIGTVVFAYTSCNAVNVDFGDDNEPIYCDCDCLELYTEPTQHAEKKPNVGSIKIPVEVDLTDSYWDAYAADLAKEVALKVANKYNDPKEAAEYAVSVAKAVVEGMKRK